MIRKHTFRKVARDRLLASQEYSCCYCKSSLTRSSATLEHLMPRSKGGTDHESNLAVSCQDCNSLKGSMTHPQYLKYIKNTVSIQWALRKLNLQTDRSVRNILKLGE